MVFIHGTGGHLETFNRNVFAHAEHFRVLALDMVGHGFSAKPDHPYEIRQYVKHLDDFLTAVGVDRAHLHGESLGGWIAAQYAIDHPARVARLVLNTARGMVSLPSTNSVASPMPCPLSTGTVKRPRWSTSAANSATAAASALKRGAGGRGERLDAGMAGGPGHAYRAL